MIDLKIQYCFRYLRHAGAGVSTHTHSGYELVYYASGAGTLMYGEEKIDFLPGCMAMSRPRVPHSETWADDTEVWCVIFESGDPLLAALPDGMYVDTAEEIFPLLEAMFAEQQETRPGWEEISLCYLELILRFLVRRKGNYPRAAPNRVDRLESVLYYIQDYYNTNISFEELALSVGYSYDRFRHLFKQRYGIAPKQMVLSKRFEMAKRMLRETDEKIENIAAACGFGSVTQFNVMFKKHRGMTPNAYRAERRK